MPIPPSTATLNPATTITWSDESLFNGFLLLGLVVPTSGGTAWAELDLGGETTNERLPIFTRVAVVDGKFDTTVGILYNSAITPPNSKYAAWYYDTSVPARQINGPSTLFSVSATPLTPPTLTFTVPTAGVTAPTPGPAW